MKIKALAIFALFATLAAQAARDTFVRQNESFGRRGNVDDVLVSPFEDAKIKRKETGIFFHRRDKRPAAEQAREADAAYLRGDLSGACARYDKLVRSWPFAAEAPRAQANLAKIMEKRGKYDRAFEEYRYCLHFYPENTPADETLTHMYAIANWKLGRGRDDMAVKYYISIVSLAPAWKNTPEAYMKIGMAKLDDREWYDAADAFDTLSTNFPDHPLAITAAEKHALALYALSLKYKEDEAIQRRALALATTALRLSPRDSPDRPTLEANFADLTTRRNERGFAIARFYDTRRFPPETRIAAYEDFLRKFPAAPQADEARRRLAVLKAAAAETQQATN